MSITQGVSPHRHRPDIYFFLRDIPSPGPTDIPIPVAPGPTFSSALNRPVAAVSEPSPGRPLHQCSLDQLFDKIFEAASWGEFQS